jgi:hypothetical protein
MAESSLFRDYLIAKNSEGGIIEVLRDGRKVTLLAFDMRRLQFVHCHALLEPVADLTPHVQSCLLIQKLANPLLCTLLEYGEDEGCPFFITAAVDGETLGAYLDAHDELPCWWAAMIACQCLDVLRVLGGQAELLRLPVLESLRILQTGPQSLIIVASDYALEPVMKTAAVRQDRHAFDKAGQELRQAFVDVLKKGGQLADTPFPSAELARLLKACMSQAFPGNITAIRTLRKELQSLVPENLQTEIPAAQKPLPLLAQELARYQDVARSVQQVISIHSQRLDPANPYAIRGSHLLSGRSVWVEQVLPTRLAAFCARLAAEKIYRNPQPERHPHLQRIGLILDADGLTSMAEEVQEGITLAELLAARQSLPAAEVYLVLAALDAALAELEAIQLEMPRLRLEDIHLITGHSREDPATLRLIHTRLTDWPSFRLCLRAHPTLASCYGRGTDPAQLLPPPQKMAAGARRGDWLAALSHLLLGLAPFPGPFTRWPKVPKPLRPLETLIQAELEKASTGASGSRMEYLARYARVMELNEMPQAEPLGQVCFDERQFLSPSQPLPTAEVPRSPLSGPMLLEGKKDMTAQMPRVGFAETLFQANEKKLPSLSSAEPVGWLSQTLSGGEVDHDVYRPGHWPLWQYLVVLLIGSFFTAAAYFVWLRFGAEP